MAQDGTESKARILVVDDEEGVRDMFTALLTVAGYQVRTEPSGAQALAYLEAQPDGFPTDLVILDVLMPGLDGHEVCRRIKRHPRLKYIPVLMVTALGSFQDRIQGMDIGADDYVAKPFRTEELLVRVRALLRISQVQRELLARNAELAALRRFNESILQNMGNGLLTVDLEGHITTLNQAAAAILGQGEWLGQPLEALGPGAAALTRLLEETMEETRAHAHQELTILAGEGREVPLRATSTLLQDEQAGIKGVICVLEDLTAIKAMEEEQRRLDRLAALGQMSATVAHEIRNPLMTLALGIGYLERSLGEETPHADTLQRLRRQVERLTGIMNEFLAFSRAPQLNLAPCDLTQVLDGVLDGAEPGFAEANMRIRRDYAPSLALALDAEHMERAFTNLAFNALDAMTAGGELAVRARAMPTAQWLAAHPEAPSAPPTPEMVVVDFQDTGSGIAPEAMAHIFEPFFTTKSKGTGLGLAIVERTVREHGGHIGVESAPGQGTTFTISLPRRV